MSIEVKFTDSVTLTPSNVPTKFCFNNQNTLGEKYKNVISDPKNGHHFPLRWFKVKFADKVPLMPIKVPMKFCWNNQNKFGEKCKKYHFTP